MATCDVAIFCTLDRVLGICYTENMVKQTNQKLNYWHCHNHNSFEEEIGLILPVY